MTTQAEELDTGFGGEIDTPEIEAQGKLSDYFGGSGTQSVLQLVFEGEAVSYTHLTLPTNACV